MCMFADAAKGTRKTRDRLNKKEIRFCVLCVCVRFVCIEESNYGRG